MNSGSNIDRNSELRSSQRRGQDKSLQFRREQQLILLKKNINFETLTKTMEETENFNIKEICFKIIKNLKQKFRIQDKDAYLGFDKGLLGDDPRQVDSVLKSNLKESPDNIREWGLYY